MEQLSYGRQVQRGGIDGGGKGDRLQGRHRRRRGLGKRYLGQAGIGLIKGRLGAQVDVAQLGGVVEATGRFSIAVGQDRLP